MPQSKDYKIKVSKDGPYIVSGGAPVHDADIVMNDEEDSVAWHQHHQYDKRESCSLCRCGRSKTKPYCDGSHVEAGFNGSETASMRPIAERTAHIEGPRLDLDDTEELCAGARFCDRAGGIWNLVEEDDAVAVRTATEEACNCPSGRLVVKDKNGKVIEPELEPGIAVVHDPAAGGMGPLWVKGGIPVTSADGKTYEVRNRVTLCRCGRSKNKPFCDASHIEPV